MVAAARRISGFADGAWLTAGDGSETLIDKFDGRPVAEVAVADAATVRAAVAGVARAAVGPRLSPRARADVLLRAAGEVVRRRQELIAIVQADTGFALRDAEKEVDRTAETLTLSAEEAKRLTGHLVPVEGTPGGAGRLSYTRLDPIGVVCALTPFNSPLNTVAHKIGPAIAAGNAVVLKPASLTPLSAQALVEILLEAGLPPEQIALVFGAGSTVGQWLSEAPEIGYYAFTGSTAVGERLHRSVGMRKVQLEMGSLASTIVCADADLEAAADAVVGGALRKAGQVCTSVQRVFAQREVIPELTALVEERMRRERAGDPADAATTVGPLISRGEADRVSAWVREAVDAGAEARCGGTSDGSVVDPALLIDVPQDAKVMTSELFGPAVLVAGFDTVDEAFRKVDDTPYGLAAGVFTRDLSVAMAAADRLQVGALYINQTSASRTDAMPFGGLKASGFGGHEGPAYAVRDMSTERVVTISRG